MTQPQINPSTGRRLFDPKDTVGLLAKGQGHQTQLALTATGSTRADALQLLGYGMQRVGTAAAGTGVTLPSAQPGIFVMLANDGAETLAVYALGSDTINGTAGSTGVTQVTTAAALYFCCVAGKWHRVLTA